MSTVGDLPSDMDKQCLLKAASTVDDKTGGSHLRTARNSVIEETSISSFAV
ncbi:MAG: hypothetical protein Q7T82_15050 [Armatimonadota bacterium]|nr:hypothetical protein [Armatimonadota bacterium]